MAVEGHVVSTGDGGAGGGAAGRRDVVDGLGRGGGAVGGRVVKGLGIGGRDSLASVKQMIQALWEDRRLQEAKQITGGCR